MIYILIMVGLVAVDQLTKVWARGYLSTVGSVPIIENFFHLTYVENRGAAFGVLQGGSYFFAVVSIAIMIGLVIYLKKCNAPKLQWNLGFVIIAGAIGNLIDRLSLGFVTDMIDFRGIWQWVFNVADMYVVVGGLLLVVAMLKEEKEAAKKEQENNL